MEQCPRLSLGCRYRSGSSAPGAGWGGRRVKPARRWRSQAAGPGLPRPPPAFYPARPGSGAGGRRVPASSLLGRRGGRSGRRGGCSQSQRRPRAGSAPPLGRVGPQRGLRLCHPQAPRPSPRTRGGAAQPGREPPSLPGEPRTGARAWRPAGGTPPRPQILI